VGQGGQRGGGELVLLALVTRLTGQDHSGQEAEHADHQLRLLVRPGAPADHLEQLVAFVVGQLGGGDTVRQAQVLQEAGGGDAQLGTVAGARSRSSMVGQNLARKGSPALQKNFHFISGFFHQTWVFIHIMCTAPATFEPLSDSKEAATSLVPVRARWSHPIMPLMTPEEVALELRCSRAHIYNVLSGKVAGLPPLPTIRIGRRTLIRRAAFEEWLRKVEVGERAA